MIKTEIESDNTDLINEPVEANNEPANVSITSPARSLAYSIALFVLLLGVSTYLVNANNTSSKASLPTARNLGNVSALPLITNSLSSTQNGSTVPSLSASGINLQNNLPSGQGSPKTNSLQSTGNSLSTGQTINTTFPY